MVLFFLFMILKPFYLQSSGSVGVADICLMGCFILLLGQWLLQEQRERKGRNTFWWKRERRICYHRDFLFYCFLACVLMINLFYCIWLRNLEFMEYSIYWFYNGLAIWTWRTMADRYGRPFFQMVNTAAKINIVVQFIIWAFGRGRIYYEYWGAVRYMGTFNNPLQLGFFLLMMLVLIWMYRYRYDDRSFWLFLALASLPLLNSESLGMWLGVAVWGIAVLGHTVYLLWKRGSVPGWLLIGSSVCLLSLAALVLYRIWPPADFDICLVEYNLVTRFQEKIWKVMDRGIFGLILDREWGRLLLYPQYLLWGAGEGGFVRFIDAGDAIELHSTWLSIWFCYGAVPMAMVILWLQKVLKANTPQMWCAIAGLLVESFFLINYRQPMFWMILLYADVTGEKADGAVVFALRKTMWKLWKL